MSEVRQQASGLAMVVIACLLVGVSSTAISCASAGGRLVLTEDAVHDALARVDDGLRTFCTSPEAAAAPAQNACGDARTALIPALEAGRAFNRAVAQQDVQELQTLMAAVGRLSDAVKAIPGGPTASWIRDLAQAIAAAYQNLGGAQ